MNAHLPGLFASPNLTHLVVPGNKRARLVIERYKVDDIAQLLHISPHTVANHIRNIHEKTSTRTIADLVDYGIHIT